MADLWLAPYEEAVGEFPITGTPVEQWRAALALATLAPSIHNTQPWWCRAAGSALEVHADWTRALLVADPASRELIISIGALIEHLVIVVGRFGLRVSVIAGPLQGDHLATLELGPLGSVDPLDRMLFDGIRWRRTNRRPFSRQPVPEPTLELARRVARERNADLALVLRSSDRKVLTALVSEADRVQMANPAFREELASWLRWFGPDQPDGIPARAGKAPAIIRPVAPLAVRTVDLGNGVAAYDRRLMNSSPALALLTTAGDGREDWVNAGRGLARALLSLAADGVSASFLNQATEVPEIRSRLGALVEDGGVPQAVLRLGYGPPVASTPRRPIDEILRP